MKCTRCSSINISVAEDARRTRRVATCHDCGHRVARSIVNTHPNSRFTRLRDERVKRNITQAQLADAAGFTKGYISLLESGQRDLSEELADLLLDTITFITQAREEQREAVEAAVNEAMQHPRMVALRRQHGLATEGHR
jgi:transcriptional regulator with XRE-family HTH domain